MRRFALVAVVLAAMLVSYGMAKSWPRPQTPSPRADDGMAIPAPEMIGEGIISTDDDELGGGVTPDGKTLIFEKSAAPHYLYIMCESHLVNGAWSKPEILPFSGQYRDTDPVIAPDGKSILFASDRPVNAKDLHRWSIWRARRIEEKNTARSGGATEALERWSEPELVPGAVNSEGSQVFASIAANGNIYFASSRKTGDYDVFRAKLVNGQYKEAEDLGPVLNGPGIDTFEAEIAPDESYLLLGSFGREGGYGSSDIFVSYREQDGWGKPINLGPQINGRARDYSPRISGDGKWLYFTSERGFLDEKREKPFTYQEVNAGLSGVMNGLGNLYRVPLDPVLRAARKQQVGVH
jgi:WD40-like Beta Propeller Repeat